MSTEFFEVSPGRSATSTKVPFATKEPRTNLGNTEKIRSLKPDQKSPCAQKDPISSFEVVGFTSFRISVILRVSESKSEHVRIDQCQSL